MGQHISKPIDVENMKKKHYDNRLNMPYIQVKLKNYAYIH